MAHIGIDARLTAYRMGGISTYIRRLVAALEQIDQENQYTILHSRKAEELIVSRFDVGSVFTPPHHRLERIALSAELTRFNLDLLHSPDFIPPRRGAKRHIITVHDLTFLLYPQHKDDDSRYYYNDQIEAAVSHADHILSVSKATKQDLIGMLGIRSDKITVQPNGIDSRLKPYSLRKRNTLSTMFEHYEGLPGKYILFVGTFEPRKNIPCLLDAYELLPTDIRNEYALLMVGQPGWLFDDTLDRIEMMQRNGYRIEMRNNVSDAALVDIYNVASVLVLPSLYEGFGLPPLEALACGTPAIVSNTSSLPEVVGDVGILFDPNDPHALVSAIIHALSDDEQARALRLGPRHAANFTWEQSARIALSVYQRFT